MTRLFATRGGLQTYVADLITINSNENPLLTVMAFYAIEALLLLKNLDSLDPKQLNQLKQILDDLAALHKFVKEEFKESLFKKIDDFEKEYNENYTPKFTALSQKTDEIYEKLDDPASAAVVISAIEHQTYLLLEDNERTRQLVRDSTKDIQNNMNNQFQQLYKNLDEIKKEIIDKTAEEAALRILGIPYARFQSTSTWYPTLMFIFVEDVIANRRSTQISARIPTETK